MFESLVADRAQNRCTIEQAYRGIQAFVSENCDPKVVLQLDESLLAYMQAAVDSHECPLEFLEDLASYFQFYWSEKRWAIWLKLRDKSVNTMTKKQRKAAWERWQEDVAPQFTVRRLAELIARKARVPSFAPVTIFGSHCEPAGAFLGICSLPEAKGGCHAPSTPLRMLGGSARICDLWTRAEWASGAQLPPINPLRLCQPQTPAQHVRMVTFGLTGFAIFLITITAIAQATRAAQETIFSHSIVSALVSATVAGLVMFGIHQIAERTHDPLPTGVKTFGDLARMISVQTRKMNDRSL
jgi:hypothetical protein